MATIGELANVPEPGGGVQSQWAQDVSARVHHRFASKAALDAWASALVGTLAITTDSGIEYRRVGGGWARVTPRYGSIPGFAGTWGADR